MLQHNYGTMELYIQCNFTIIYDNLKQNGEKERNYCKTTKMSQKMKQGWRKDTKAIEKDILYSRVRSQSWDLGSVQ